MPHPAGQRTIPRRLILELAFPPLAADLDGVAVHVRIEDVGEADAPARLLLQRDFRLVRVSRDARKAALEIDIPDLGNVALPAIRVHVDLSGAGAIRPGDFINPAIVEVPDDARRPCRIGLVEVR
jgi:hypothetical protein